MFNVFGLLVVFNLASLAAPGRVGGQIILPAAVAELPGASDVNNPTVEAEVAESRPALRVLARQRLGLTVRNVVRALQAMKADGTLAAFVSAENSGGKSVNVSALAIGVAQRLAAERPEAWQAVDWDQVIEFLERLIALLAEWLPILIDLFTSVQPAAAIVGEASPAVLVLAA